MKDNIVEIEVAKAMPPCKRYSIKIRERVILEIN